MSSTPKTSVVIPLYRSARFYDNIISNVESITRQDVEIIISDRHCYDDTIDRLSERYAGDNRVRCLKNDDCLDWVGHLNALLQQARGKYWRFMPHDDLSPPGSLEALVAALDDDPDAVLAYGPTRAIDLAGRAVREKDRPNPHPEKAQHAWDLGIALEMFWNGYFDGAFKGLIRRQRVLAHRLSIRSTPGQVLPERCWLFALCLLGSFRFVAEAWYIKRYYAGSTHTRWVISARSYSAATRVMSGYVLRLVGPLDARLYALLDLRLNCGRIVRWEHTSRPGQRPPYHPHPGPLNWFYSNSFLARVPVLQRYSDRGDQRVRAIRAMPLPKPRSVHWYHHYLGGFDE